MEDTLRSSALVGSFPPKLQASVIYLGKILHCFPGNNEGKLAHIYATYVPHIYQRP